jgi:hypothetical protein
LNRLAFLDVIAIDETHDGICALVVFQSEHLSALDTVLVVPCRAVEAASAADLGRLTPVIELEGCKLRAYVPELASIPRSRLTGEVLGSATPSREAMMAGLDLLVLGW